MKYIKKILFPMVLVSLMHTVALADDQNYRSGLSLHLVSHHNGLQLNYSTVIQPHRSQYNNRYQAPYTSPIRSQYKQYKRPQLIYPRHVSKPDLRRPYKLLKPRYSNRFHDARQYNRRDGIRHSIPAHNRFTRPQSGYFNRQNKPYLDTNRYDLPKRHACRPVTKIVSNRYGHSERVAGKLCYDQNGHRHLILNKHYRH